jgi:hypothetical protein
MTARDAGLDAHDSAIFSHPPFALGACVEETRFADGLPGSCEIRGAVVVVNRADVALFGLAAVRPTEVGVDASTFSITRRVIEK